MPGLTITRDALDQLDEGTRRELARMLRDTEDAD